MKTATRWHVFCGHDGAVVALDISPDGRHLASFSPHDSTVRIWSMSSGLLGLFGQSPRQVRAQAVPRPSAPMSAEQIYEFVRLRWSTDGRTVELSQGAQAPRVAVSLS